MPPSERKKQVELLENKAGELLDLWTYLDEHLQKLKRNSQRNEALAYSSSGTVYYELSMYNKAIYLLKNEVAIGPLDDVRRLYLAYAYLFTAQYDEAKEQFLYVLHASRIWLMKHFCYVGLGLLYTQTDQIDEAIHHFERAKQITTTTDVMYNLGICFFVKEQYALAKEYFNQYLLAVPDDSEAMFYLGCCYWNEENRDQAWAYWLSSLQHTPSQETVLAVAHVCEWLGNHQMAIHCYKQMQRKNVDVLHGLAWNYALLKRKEEAYQSFRDALHTDPSNKKLHASLAWLNRHWPEGKWLQLMQGSHTN